MYYHIIHMYVFLVWLPDQYCLKCYTLKFVYSYNNVFVNWNECMHSKVCWI